MKNIIFFICGFLFLAVSDFDLRYVRRDYLCLRRTKDIIENSASAQIPIKNIARLVVEEILDRSSLSMEEGEILSILDRINLPDAPVVINMNFLIGLVNKIAGQLSGLDIGLKSGEDILIAGEVLDFIQEPIADIDSEAEPKTWEDKLAYYERHGVSRETIEKNRTSRQNFLQVADPRIVVHRLEELQKFFDEHSTQRIDVKQYPILASRSVSTIISRAKYLDYLVRDEGLKVSYRYGEGIEVFEPEILLLSLSTVGDNLRILKDNKIDQVQHKYLLLLSTFKLSTNIRFLEHVIARHPKSGINITEHAYLLKQPILALQNNYILLEITGTAVEAAKLNYTTEALLEYLNAGKGGANLSSDQIKILTGNLKEMLVSQRKFFDWYSEENLLTEEAEGRRVFDVQWMEVNSLFESSGFSKLGPSAYYLFNLMTCVYVTNRLGRALGELVKFSMQYPQYISKDAMVDSLSKKYNLSNQDKYRLAMIIIEELRLRSRLP